jgi:hypothetical protein
MTLGGSGQRPRRGALLQRRFLFGRQPAKFNSCGRSGADDECRIAAPNSERRTTDSVRRSSKSRAIAYDMDF